MGRFTATISGISVGVLDGSLRISDTLNGRRTCAFEVFDRFSGAFGGLIPDGLVGRPVTIHNAGELIFGGMIQDQGSRTKQSLFPNPDLFLSLLCADYSVLADRHVVFWVYENQSLKEIVQDLISRPGAGSESLASDGVEAIPVVLDVDGAATNGPIIQRFITDGAQSVSQILDKLCEITGFSWIIDYDLVVKLRQSGIAAPFGISDGVRNFLELEVTSSLADYRNEQFLTRDLALIPPFIEVFVGDDATRDWFLQQNLGDTPTVILRKSVNASVVLTLTGLPLNNETVIVDGQTYKFVTALTGGPDEVLIAALPRDCNRNLSYAINSASGFEGLYYGAGTIINATCQALGEQGPALTVRAKRAGDTENGIVVSETLTNGSWSTGTLTGGSGDPLADEVQTVGVIGQDQEGTFDWYWLIGTTKLARDGTLDPVAAGSYLEVIYHALFSNVVSVRNQAEVEARGLIEGNSGLTSSVASDQGSNTGSYADSVARGLLRRYGRLPRTCTLTLNDEGEPTANQLRAGMHVQIVRTDYNLDQSFLVESVEHSDVSGLFMQYSVKLIGFPDGIGEAQGSWVDFLGSLFGSSSSGSGGGRGGGSISGSGGATSSGGKVPGKTGSGDIGNAGTEVAGLVVKRVPFIVLGVNIPQPDGTYAVAASVDVAVPDDPRYASSDLIVRYEDDAYPEQTLATNITKFPYKFNYKPTATVVNATFFVVSKNTDGESNTIVPGVTPSETLSQGTGAGQLDFAKALGDSLGQWFDVVDGEFIIKDLSILREQLADSSVITSKLGALSVDNSKLADLAVDAAKLANSAVTATKIANLAVGSAAIAALAVGTAHIANLAVTDAKVQSIAAIKITAGTLAAGVVYAGTVNANQINAGTLNAVNMNGGTLTLNFNGVTTTVANIYAGGSFPGSNQYIGIKVVNNSIPSHFSAMTCDNVGVTANSLGGPPCATLYMDSGACGALWIEGANFQSRIDFNTNPSLNPQMMSLAGPVTAAGVTQICKVVAGPDYVYSVNGTGATCWAIGRATLGGFTGGIVRVCDGSGFGQLDGIGSRVLLYGSTGLVVCTALQVGGNFGVSDSVQVNTPTGTKFLLFGSGLYTGHT